MKFNHKSLLFSIVSVLFFCCTVWSQNNDSFIVILDAGHGGKDPGNSYHGFVEKEIALQTTLKVGKLLEKEKNIKVIYTRTTDVFIELVNRPKVANKADANLFVSIHCNSVTNQTPSGTETFVMGLSRSGMNLEVAKSENSVILLEDNYKETYQNFDPKKPESLIGLTMLQEENMSSSIDLATKIQENFTHNLERKSRGVKQQPLWVLDAAYMPSVLIELGFLSNKEEGEFLNSDEGQNKMAKQIAEAIIDYKHEYFNENSSNEVKNTPDNPSRTAEKATVLKSEEDKVKPDFDGVFYKIQLFATSKKRNANSADFKGLNDISFTLENNLYKYFYGKTNDLNEIKEMYLVAKKNGFKDAFIVSVIDGKTSALK